MPEKLPKVLVLYPTRNDFVPNVLLQSMKQEYKNYEFYILDDSDDLVFIKRIDEFAKKHNVKVVRRNIHDNKAGNINHFFRNLPGGANKYQWDYFAILDADIVAPKNFLSDSIPLFYSTQKKLGYIQTFQTGYKTNSVYQNIRMPNYEAGFHLNFFQNRITQPLCLGRGVIISKKCFADIGYAFPNFVSEDVALSFEVISKGWTSIISNLVTCGNMSQVNYVNEKKLMVRMDYANITLVERKWRKIFRMKSLFNAKVFFSIRFIYEISAITPSFFSFVNTCVFVALNFHQSTSQFLLFGTIIFAIVPFLNDILCYVGRMNIFAFVIYAIVTGISLSAMFYSRIEAWVLKVIFRKKAFFWVSPKHKHKISFIRNLIHNRRELIAMSCMILFSILAYFYILTPATQNEKWWIIPNFLYMPLWFQAFFVINFCQFLSIFMTLIVNIRPDKNNETFNTNSNIQPIKYLKMDRVINSELAKHHLQSTRKAS